MSDKLILNMIKTNDGCFITDCQKKKGTYDYKRFRSDIPSLKFDGVQAEETFDSNWFYISNYPEKIEKIVKGGEINKMYVIKDKDMISKALPEVMSFDEMNANNYDIHHLYKYKYDKEDDKVITVDFEINILSEITNFKRTGNFNFNGIRKCSLKTQQYEIKKDDLETQLIDDIIYPEFIKGDLPVKISSDKLYHIVRNHIKENINGKHASITSDYNFCLTVSKRIPYQVKTFDGITVKYKKEEIYERTPMSQKYKGYTVMEPMTGKNSDDLKDKINNYLKRLMAVINEPVKICPECNGRGVKKIVKL